MKSLHVELFCDFFLDLLDLIDFSVLDPDDSLELVVFFFQVLQGLFFQSVVILFFVLYDQQVLQFELFFLLNLFNLFLCKIFRKPEP